MTEQEFLNNRLNENKKYYLLLNRYTNLEIKRDDVKDYLEQCKEFKDIPSDSDFLDYIGSKYSFDNFLEEIEDTDIEDSTQFFKLKEEIEKND